MRAIDSDPDRPSYAVTLELGWLVLWLVCLALVVALPAWQVVPLDVIWISLALLYGFRIWPNRRMLAFTGAAVGTTGAALGADSTLGADSISHVRVVGNSVVQIPLLAVMVVAMAWQAHRWVVADDRTRIAAQTLIATSEITEFLTAELSDLDALVAAELAARGCDPAASSVTLTTSLRRPPGRQNGSG